MRFLSPLRHLFLGTTVALLAVGAQADTRVTGSGTLAGETRPVSAFQGIHLKGGIDLRVRQSTRDALELRADDNVLPLVEATVVERGGIPTLELSFRRGVDISTRNKVVATVEVATLKAVAISGSGNVVAESIKTAALSTGISGAGNIRLDQLDAGALSVDVSGSGNVAASGRAERLHIAISGSGDVVTRELQADDVKVRIAGSGDAKVYARRTLAVSIAGSGGVAHSGEATPTVAIAGSGSVKKL